MTKRSVSVTRQFELGARQLPEQPAQKSSDLDPFVNELKNPMRFASGAIALGLFATLVVLTVGFIAMPLVAWFFRLLGI